MTATASALVIINPISGIGSRPGAARARVEQAQAATRALGCSAEVLVTERPGHARELARSAMTQGVPLVIAWGGDGTINEVASALAFGRVPLGIIPSGSGNGLARELQIPFDPARAFRVAFGSDERVIDCGELDGHLFFNIAGIGLDAHVAHEFAAQGAERRGLWRYLTITAREILKYTPDEHTISVGATVVRTQAMLLAIANARQYGNGALIAPHAVLDDGLLDVVVISHRPAWRALFQIPRIFTGQVGQVPGVTMLRGTEIEVSSSHPVLYHVDGEPYVGAASLTARAHRAALRVRAARQ